MSAIRYANARPTRLTDINPGDQVLSPYGWRVVSDVTEDVNGNTLIYFWDEDPIRRIPGTTVQTMKRL